MGLHGADMSVYASVQRGRAFDLYRLGGWIYVNPHCAKRHQLWEVQMLA
jgi:hypothetical protein